MRVSYNWLNEFVDLKESPEALAEMLTMLGLEAEVASNFDDINGVIVGKVVSVRKHPNADKLSLATVSDGFKSVEVVCGAPNVAEGQTVPFAPIGSLLPGGFKIKKVKIRGMESTGMICSEKELGLSDYHDGIMELPDGLQAGSSVTDWLMKEFQSIDLDLTPNRGDALAVIGVARDISAKTGRKLNVSIQEKHKAAALTKNHVPVKLTDKSGCPRYIAGIVHGITVGPTPDWIVTKLKASGLRSINNVVDISNVVLLELGHPTHIFDLDKISAKQIDVRKAKKGEKLVGLDGETYKCSTDHLLITDGKNPLALAGIMGGKDSMVTESTTSVLIESAYFDPVTIRKGAKALGLRSEASRRFVRGADINACPAAYNRVAELLIEIAGGEAVKGYIDAYPKKFKPNKVTLSRSELDLISGQKISDTFVSKTLKALGIKAVKNKSSWSCEIPSFRPDIEREIDVIEEIIRMHGFDNVPVSTHFSGIHSTDNPDPHQTVNEISQALAGMGFRQCYSNSLQSETVAKAGGGKPVAMKNPLSEQMAHLRTSLIPGLMKKVDFNCANGNRDLRLFETGNVFVQKGKGLKGIQENHKIAGVVHGKWNKEDVHSTNGMESSLFSVKGLLQSLAARFSLNDIQFIAAESKIFDHGQDVIINGRSVGLVGKIGKEYLRSIDSETRSAFGFELNFDSILQMIGETIQYRPINTFPVSDRDLNFVLPNRVSSGSVVEAVRKEGGDLLRSVNPVNIFSGDSIGNDSRSVTFRLVFQHPSKTLEDSDVNPLIKGIIDVVSKKFDGKLRS